RRHGCHEENVDVDCRSRSREARGHRPAPRKATPDGCSEAGCICRRDDEPAGLEGHQSDWTRVAAGSRVARENDARTNGATRYLRSCAQGARSVQAAETHRREVTRAFTFVEDAFAASALLAMALLPLLEAVSRRGFGVPIPGSGPIVQHLVLWVAFLGAAIAAR